MKVEAGVAPGQQVELRVRLLLEAERERGEIADAAWDTAEQDRRDPAEEGKQLRQRSQDLGEDRRDGPQEEPEEVRDRRQEAQGGGEAVAPEVVRDDELNRVLLRGGMPRRRIPRTIVLLCPALHECSGRAT